MGPDFWTHYNIGEYTFQGDFNNNAKMNDIIKINDNQLCYISTTNEKKDLNIVTFNLYFLNLFFFTNFKY